jgi:formylglycine-generating enzyme required for sulfatase activity
MHGNVGEWVNDWYAPLGLDFVLVNPTGPSSGASRVYRDGGFDELLSYRSLFVTQRRSALPGDMQPNRGFRVVISVKH